MERFEVFGERFHLFFIREAKLPRKLHSLKTNTVDTSQTFDSSMVMKYSVGGKAIVGSSRGRNRSRRRQQQGSVWNDTRWLGWVSATLPRFATQWFSQQTRATVLYERSRGWSLVFNTRTRILKGFLELTGAAIKAVLQKFFPFK